MEFRHLGRSGLVISEIAYGNWLTHGAQIEEEAAQACVHAALDAGITSYDTADSYAGGRAEVLGRALKGQPRDRLEIFTKIYWPTGEGKNDRGLSRKHILTGIDASLRRLETDPSVSAALIGASRPDQVTENVRAAGARLDADLLERIDDVLGDVVERDPAQTKSPPRRP